MVEFLEEKTVVLFYVLGLEDGDEVFGFVVGLLVACDEDGGRELGSSSDS